MTANRSRTTTATLALSVQLIALIGIAAAALEAVSKFFGVNGAFPIAGSFFDQNEMAVPVDLSNNVVDIGDQFDWIESTNGTVDAATGLAPVAFTGPFGGSVAIVWPTFSERMVWLAANLAGPIVVILGLLLVFRIAGSMYKGNVFTAKNQRRIWQLALVVAVGGMASGHITQLAGAWIVGRSAAADVVDMTYTITFLPLVIGLGLALLASTWTSADNTELDLASTTGEFAGAIS